MTSRMCFPQHTARAQCDTIPNMEVVAFYGTRRIKNKKRKNSLERGEMENSSQPAAFLTPPAPWTAQVLIWSKKKFLYKG